MPSPRMFDEEFASPMGPCAVSSPVSSYGFISLAEYQSIVDQANQPTTSAPLNVSIPTVAEWSPSSPCLSLPCLSIPAPSHPSRSAGAR